MCRVCVPGSEQNLQGRPTTRHLKAHEERREHVRASHSQRRRREFPSPPELCHHSTTAPTRFPPLLFFCLPVIASRLPRFFSFCYTVDVLPVLYRSLELITTYTPQPVQFVVTLLPVCPGTKGDDDFCFVFFKPSPDITLHPPPRFVVHSPRRDSSDARCCLANTPCRPRAPDTTLTTTKKTTAGAALAEKR